MEKNYKKDKLITILQEFKKEGNKYQINGVDTSKAVFFGRVSQRQYIPIPKGYYTITQEGNNKYLNITNEEYLSTIEGVQIGIEFASLSSDYNVDFNVDINTLKDKYNQLVEDVKNLFGYVRKNLMIADALDVDVVLPQLDVDEVWVRTENGYRGFNIGSLETNVKQMIEEFKQLGTTLKKELNDLSDKLKLDISGAFDEEIKAGKEAITQAGNTEVGAITDLADDKKTEITQHTDEEIKKIQATGLDGVIANVKTKLTKADTIEMLKAMDLKQGDMVEVLGYYTKDDGATHKRVIDQADDGSGVQLNNGLWANIVHSGEVNVSWFGAKGDGATDDTQPIQKCLNCSTYHEWKGNVQQTNDSAYIKFRVYFDVNKLFRITQPLEIWANTQIYGSGVKRFSSIKQGILADFASELAVICGLIYDNKGTILKLKENVGNVDVDNSLVTRCKGVKINDLQIYAKQDIFYGINLPASTHCFIENNYIDNVRIGINISSSWGGVISSNLFQCKEACITLFGCTDLKIQNNYLTTVIDTELKVLNKFTVTNFAAKNKTIAVYQKFSQANVINNIIEHSNVAIYIESSSACLIQGNYLEDIENYCYSSHTCGGLSLSVGYLYINKNCKIFNLVHTSGTINCNNNGAINPLNVGAYNTEKVKVIGTNACANDTYQYADRKKIDLFVGYENNSDSSDGISKNSSLSTLDKVLELYKNYDEINIEVNDNFDLICNANNKLYNQKLTIKAKNNFNLIFNSSNNYDLGLHMFDNSNVYIFNATIRGRGDSNIQTSSFFASDNGINTINLIGCNIDTENRYYILGTQTNRFGLLHCSIIGTVITNSLLIKPTQYSTCSYVILANATSKIEEKDYNITELCNIIYTNVSAFRIKIQQLNTLYYAEKMKQEGVYDDFISYVDEKILYDKQQEQLEQDKQLAYEGSLQNHPEHNLSTYSRRSKRSLMIENLEPQPSEALKKFIDKWL